MTQTKYKHPGKIVLIEGKQTDHPSFFLSLRQKGYDIEMTATGSAAIQKMEEVDPALILIDAASLRTASNRIIYRMKQIKPEVRIILIIDSALKDKKISDKADIVMTLPFKVQTLVTQIKNIQSLSDPNARRYGKLTYNPTRRALEIHGRITGLTPILARLLELFLDNPDQTLERSEIFKRIWNTEFTDDMRTLEVHIQWLRKAVEKDPKNPKIILTQRNIGYKLESAALLDDKTSFFPEYAKFEQPVSELVV